MKTKKKKRKKVDMAYRINVDTVSLNAEEVAQGLGGVPFWPVAPWEKEIDPRRLRRKGSQVCK